MGKLDGKVALITGGNKGIGKGIARRLADEGATLVLAARGVEELDQTASELRQGGTTVLAVPTDVTDEGQIEALFERTMEVFSRLDILVNNSGAFDGGPLDELSTEALDNVLSVNLRAPFLCTRAAMRIMKQQGGGRIINIGSISAQRVRPQAGPYCASKFGIWGLTQVTALEGRPHGIVASCLHPGATQVRDVPDDGGEENRLQVDELAEAAVLMATLPAHVNMLEAIVLPVQQPYLGRG
jgi:NAD(P)-dependent dehydrogenase (short-subunit alcohol dehydrogenase family)